MPGKSISQRLIDDRPLRRIAQAVLLLILTVPNVGWIFADIAIIARGYGTPLPFSTQLFDFLKIPFSESFASLGFVVTVLVPGLVAVVCYYIDTTTVPWTTTDRPSLTGYIAIVLCLIGVALGFVSLAIVSMGAENIDAMSAGSSAAVQGLATATFTFYGVYVIQLLGLSPK